MANEVSYRIVEYGSGNFMAQKSFEGIIWNDIYNYDKKTMQNITRYVCEKEAKKVIEADKKRNQDASVIRVVYQE